MENLDGGSRAVSFDRNTIAASLLKGLQRPLKEELSASNDPDVGRNLFDFAKQMT